MICHTILYSFKSNTTVFIGTAVTGSENNMILYLVFVPLCRLVPLLSDFMTATELHGV